MDYLLTPDGENSRLVAFLNARRFFRLGTIRPESRNWNLVTLYSQNLTMEELGKTLGLTVKRNFTDYNTICRYLPSIIVLSNFHRSNPVYTLVIQAANGLLRLVDRSGQFGAVMGDFQYSLLDFRDKHSYYMQVDNTIERCNESIY